MWMRSSPEGDRKALWSPPQRRNPCVSEEANIIGRNSYATALIRRELAFILMSRERRQRGLNPIHRRRHNPPGESRAFPRRVQPINPLRH